MSQSKRAWYGCCLLPVLMVGSCAGKMFIDAKRYDLPGAVLQSPARPTQTLDSPMQVAEALDAYVQPRFEILRDKNFGAMRIVYRLHAGIVQLKVDSDREKEIIANVNAARRSYIIGLLHCAPRPNYPASVGASRLDLLYLNQQPLEGEVEYFRDAKGIEAAAQQNFDLEETTSKAQAALPTLMAGREFRTEDADWTILMRPVLASKQECLSCHTNAKPGATLGVMVYAVRKTTNTAASKIGMR